MIFRRKYILGVFLIFALMAVSSAYAQQVIFHEDFNGYNLSGGGVALGGAAQIGTWDLGATTQYVISGNGINGTADQVLLLDEGYARIAAQAIGYASGPVNISYDFCNVAGEFAGFVKHGSASSTYTRYYDPAETGLLATTYKSGGAETASLSAGSWYHMEMEFPEIPSSGLINYSSSITDANGNEVFVSNTLTNYYSNPGIDISGYMFSGNTKPLVNTMIDNVLIKSAPDPLPMQEGSWTMVVLPDTQDYLYPATTDSLAAFDSQIDWILENKKSRNIGLVLHEGDIVNLNDDSQQWQRAQDTLGRLNGQVPYVLSVGNHEYQSTDNTVPRTRDMTQLNTYFKASDSSLNDPASGGIIKGFFEDEKLENTYSEFVAPDGRKMLIFSLEFGPRQAVVDWANEIAQREEYADHTAVLLTHAFMYNDDTRYDIEEHEVRDQWGSPYAFPGTRDDTNDGEELWNELITGNENFELVFSGHTTGPAPAEDDFAAGVGTLTSLNDAGEEVHQMLFNAQHLTDGGDGWLRLIEFQADGSMQVKTYSPWLKEWRTESYDQFTLQLQTPEPASLVIMTLGGVVLLRRVPNKCRRSKDLKSA